MMKALSIRSDYAMQIMLGQKKVEYRSWQTHYRGPLLICGTAKKVKGGIPGYAICVACLTNIQHQPDQGQYAWQLAPFGPSGSYWIEPIPIKGHLSLFQVPDSLIVRVPFFDLETAAARTWFKQKIIPLRNN